MVADQLRSHRKTATIRLGDKSRKYKKGMVVSVLTGVRFGPREKVFDAVIDKVEVKKLRDLSPREIEHDNPEIRRPEEMATFLTQLYNREVTPDDTVTVIRFSQIVSPRAGSESQGLVRPQAALRTPRTSSRTPKRTARRTRGTARAPGRRTAGTPSAAPPRTPRSSAAHGRSKAERSPVAEHVATLLDQPVGRPSRPHSAQASG